MNTTQTDPVTPEVDFSTMSSFQFSGADPSQLAAASSKFTLVTLCVDTSGSISEFQKTIEQLVAEVVLACKKNPASDSLMLRVVSFDSVVNETHGFKLIGSVNPDDYSGKFGCGGRTALHDAMANAIESAVEYGKALAGSFYMANAITFVITDGQENESRIAKDPAVVARANAAATSGESLDSSELILMGLSAEPKFGAYLSRVEKECGCSKSMVIGTFSVGGPDVNAGKIAKLVGFISNSVSSTAQQCGKGGPSQTIPSQLTI